MRFGRVVRVGLTASFAVVISCATSDSPEVLDLESLRIATCAPESVITASDTIGNEGGTITAGANSLLIPAHSLLDSTVITMTVGGDSTRSVTFQPEGLLFQSNRPAVLTLHYNGCTFDEDTIANPAGHIPGGAGIAFVGTNGAILEFKAGTIDTTANTISGQLRHFSRYAVAW